MAEVDVSPELAPYVNPEYWNGHSIGTGQTITESPPSTPDIESVGIQRKLQTGLRTMVDTTPLEVFWDDEVFNPDHYPLGTIVALREEVLLAGPHSRGIDSEQFRGLSLPDKPARNPFYFDVNQHRSIGEDGLNYSSGLKWGIVAERDRRGRQLHTVPATVVQRNSRGLAVSGMPSPRQSLTEVGKTNHTVSMSGTEKLMRANLLEVMSYGQAANGNGNGNGLRRQNRTLAKRS